MSLLGGFDWMNPLDILFEIVSLIPKLVYFLGVMAMSLLDIAQLVLRKVAGLDYYYVGDSTEPQTGDIALNFIRGIFDSNSAYPALRNTFISLLIIAVLLLIITTIISVIRQEYEPGEQELRERPTNSKMWVMFRSIRAMFLFLIVPVAVLFGLMFSDILLKAMDSATSSGVVGGTLFTTPGVIDKLKSQEVLGSDGDYSYTNFDFFGYSSATTNITYSGVIFKSSAYMSNRIRMTKSYAVTEADATVEKTFYELVVSDNGYINNFGILNLADSKEDAAQMLDEAFSANVILKTPETLNTDNPVGTNVSTMIFTNTYVTNFSKFNVGLVWYYYDLWQYNYIVSFAFIYVSLRLFINIVGGLLKRIVEMLALFLISPPIIAVFPLDNGKAFSQWRQTFVGRALQAFGSIIGLNIFFIILPYLNEIKFISAVDLNIAYSGNVAYMVNSIFSMLFMIVGLTSVEGFIELLSSFTGSESAAEVGQNVVGKAGDTIAAAAKWTGAAAGVATAPYKAGAKAIGFGVGKLGGNKVANAVKNSKAGKAVKRAAGMTKKKAGEVREKFQKTWGEGGSDAAYNDYISDAMSNNDNFFKDVTSSYENRSTGSSMGMDDWMQSQEGRNAIGKVAARNNMQSKDDFASATTGAGAAAYKRMLNDQLTAESNFGEATTERLTRVMSAPLVGDAINATLDFGKHLSAYGSNIPILFEDGFQRDRKMGFKSMLMAFQGKSAKQIELEEIYTKQKAQESQKAKIQEKARANASKKDAEKQFEENNKLKINAKEIADIKRDVAELKKKNK